MAIRHHDGWCIAADPRLRFYAENLKTRCGQIITCAWDVREHPSTCVECNNALAQKPD